MLFFSSFWQSVSLNPFKSLKEMHQSQASQSNFGQEKDSEGGLASRCLTQTYMSPLFILTDKVLYNFCRLSRPHATWGSLPAQELFDALTGRARDRTANPAISGQSALPPEPQRPYLKSLSV